MAEVEITTGGHTVRVVGDKESAKVLAELAEGIHSRTRDPDADRRSTSVMGFTTEIHPGALDQGPLAPLEPYPEEERAARPRRRRS